MPFIRGRFMFVCHVGGPLCIRRKLLVGWHMGIGVCANVASVYGALVLVGLLPWAMWWIQVL